MEKNTTKREPSYRQLGFEEREEIAIGLEKGENKNSIAKQLNRHRSTICRELKRNSPKVREVHYRANRAQIRSDERKRGSHFRERLKTPEIRAYVDSKIRIDWTPEIIAGRLSLEKPGLKTNYESIYQWIYTERRNLIIHLPRGHKKRRKRGTSKNKRTIRIPNRVLIDKRPEEVERRENPGHWEADTAVSRQSKAAVVIVQERKTRYCFIRKLLSKTAENMCKGLIKCLESIPKRMMKTITYDNGTENAEHEAINKSLDIQSYFCHPYHSWEKGSVENCIGLLRRYYPKKTNWALQKQSELNKIVRRLNTRPKKCLGFKTPEEVFVALTA
jgi:IS30 family transposase